MVTRPAQHTRALELDSPELAGTVPSTTQHIPANEDKLKCSCIHMGKGQMTDYNEIMQTCIVCVIKHPTWIPLTPQRK